MWGKVVSFQIKVNFFENGTVSLLCYNGKINWIDLGTSPSFFLTFLLKHKCIILVSYSVFKNLCYTLPFFVDQVVNTEYSISRIMLKER